MKLKKILTALAIASLLLLMVAAAPLATRYIFGGAVIVGTSDQIQLRVTGWTTQTNNLLTLEQSDGTDVLTVTNAGNLSYAGTSSLNGNTTIAGTVLVDGQADANQLTVQGHTTQTTNLLTLEQSDGTDVLTITNAGRLNASSDISHDGLLIGSTTTVTVTDGQTITPTTSLYILDAAGAVTVTLAACSNNDQQLRLFGNDAQTITVADTNIRTTDGDVVTLGQYDIVGWNCVSTEWIHAYKSANQ